MAAADATVAVAETVPCLLPSARFSVNEADEDALAGIGTEPALSDEPPVWDSETSMADPDVLVTTFWNWSTSWTRAVMNREVPRGAAGLSVQLNEAPAEPVQVTRAGLLPLAFPADASVKLRPAAGPAVIVSVWLPGVTPYAAAVMTGCPAVSSP